MKKVRRKLNRIGALALAVVLMGTSIDFPVIAAGNCEHHTEHTAECGYKDAVEGSECTHEHGDECYSEEKDCVHSHDGECGYVEAVEGADCNHSHDENCGENGEECNHEHDDSCGYKEPQEGSECNHECSEESGCITLEENCNHSHDESCGYKEAVEGAPCIFACDDCASEESDQENEEENDTCICEDKCTVEAVNEECPVCSLEEADLALCVGEETAICTCETDDPAFHATNCPAYIAPENPQCYCAEKCTEDTLNVWCDVCGMQGVSACQGEDTAVAYEIVASGTCGAEGNESSVTWSLDNEGTLTISGTGAMADYELVVDDYPYHYTTPWHNTDNDGRYQNSNIKKVVVEEGVTHIGSSAFKDFTELTSISIPNTVKSIGYGSISYCEKLTSLVIPDSVTSIGEEAFYQNMMLTSVTIGNRVESIGGHAFYRVGCNAGTNFTITLPKSVTSIAPSAFTSIYKGATIRYSCSYNEGNGYSTENNTFNATLKQYHLYEYSGSGNKINCSGCTCGEYSSSKATLSLSSDEPIYYTGEEIKPAVTVSYPDDWVGDEIEPSENNCTYSYNINAGTATCTFKYAEGVEASLDFTIEKVDSVITAAPTPADLVYDGTALNLINAGTTTDGEMQYSLNGTNYSRTIPTGTDVGEYTVWYKVVGDKNHNDTEPEKVEVSIAKGTPDIGTVSASNLANTLDVSQVVLSRSNETVPGTLSLADGTTLQYGIHDYTYVFTPNDNTNYETVTGTVSITITDTNAPTATYKVGTDGWKQFINTITFGHFCKDYTTVDITYSDEGSGVADKQYYISEEEITNTENIQWSEYTDTLNINATGKYYIYVRVTDNYGNVVIQNSEGIVVYAESAIAPTSFSCEYGEENALYVDIFTNGNTFANLTDGSGNEIDTENYSYSIDERILTIKGEYLSDLDVGTYTYKICMNPQGVENTEVTLAYSFVVKVTAKELTVTGATATSRDYIANDKTVDITGITLRGKLETDDVSVEITGLKGTLGSANAGTYTSVTLPTLTLPTFTLTGDDAKNYVLVQPTSAVATNVTINKLNPTITLTVQTSINKTYGDEIFDLGATEDSPEAGLQYEVTEGADVVSVSSTGKVTILKAGDATITVTVPASTNYNSISKEISVTVEKAENAPNMPGNAMNVSNSYTKIGDVPLPTGWEWQDADKATPLTVDTPVTATAVYVGADKGNYENESVEIVVTRADHDHVESEVLYDTNAGEHAPTCTEDGLGHVECTIEGCDETLRTNVVVDAFGHNYVSKVTKQPTTIEEGIMTYTCSNCGDSYTKPISKLPSSGGGSDDDSGDDETGGSSDGGSTNDTPATETPTPQTPAGGTTAPTTPQPGGKTPVAELDEETDNPEPFIKGEDGKEGWDVIRDEVEDAEEGDTVTVDMNGITVVPGDVFDDIKGKDVTVVFDLGNGVAWSVNGKDITSDNVGDIDFEVKVGADANDSIPVEVRNAVTGESDFVSISLAYDGEFGFKAVLSVNLEKENAGLYANLFYYNPQTNEMEFICSDVIAEDGTAELIFTHASEYTIVIDKVAMDAPASSEEGVLPEIGLEAEEDNSSDATNVSDPLEFGSDDNNSAWWIILLIALLAVTGVAGFVVYSKKKKSE